VGIFYLRNNFTKAVFPKTVPPLMVAARINCVMSKQFTRVESDHSEAIPHFLLLLRSIIDRFEGFPQSFLFGLYVLYHV